MPQKQVPHMDDISSEVKVYNGYKYWWDKGIFWLKKNNIPLDIAMSFNSHALIDLRVILDNELHNITAQHNKDEQDFQNS